MIRNYIKTAFRLISRNKVFSIINILGFSVGLISSLIIFLFVKHEINFENHIPDNDQIYRVVLTVDQNRDTRYESMVPYPLGHAIISETTGYEKVSNIYVAAEPLISAENKKFKEKGVVFANENFVQLFHVEVIKGEPRELNEPGNVFLSQKLAKKYFGDKDPVGETLELEQELNLKVAGIIKEAPSNTHIPYQMIVSAKSLNKKIVGFGYDNWNSRISGFSSYVKLKESTSREDFEHQLRTVVKENVNESEDSHYFLQPIREIHLAPEYESFSGAYTTSKTFIWIFISVGLFILLIASINFINLSTVQAIKRTREIGVRKVLGADRAKIIRQFLGETLFLILAAEIIALIITEIILPKINNLLGSEIQLNLYSDFSVIIFLVVVLFVFGLASGIYPALFLSRYKPVQALRTKSGGSGKNSAPIFGFLVVLQFFISQILIVSAILIGQQMNYFKSKDLGFQKENVLLLNLYGIENTHNNALKQKLEQIPEVQSVSFAIGAPLANSGINSNVVVPGREDEFHANVKTIDENYTDFYNLEIISGRMFNIQSAKDSVQEILVNQKLVEKLDLEKPEDAIGKRIICFGGNSKIVGIVENFHTTTLHEQIGPTILLYMPRFLISASVKLNENYSGQTMDQIRETWNTVYPHHIFDHKFLEDEIEKQYIDEERTSKIIQIFAFVAIIIACLGLYGLVSFIMMHRTKEIGIRKTMGATAKGLIALLSRQYLKYVIIAGLLAWPVAYYLMKGWLQDFAYHIDITIWYFVFATVLLVFISFLTIFYKTLKTANTNPVDSLRYE